MAGFKSSINSIRGYSIKLILSSWRIRLEIHISANKIILFKPVTVNFSIKKQPFLHLNSEILHLNLLLPVTPTMHTCSYSIPGQHYIQNTPEQNHQVVQYNCVNLITTKEFLECIHGYIQNLAKCSPSGQEELKVTKLAVILTLLKKKGKFQKNICSDTGPWND